MSTYLNNISVWISTYIMSLFLITQLSMGLVNLMEAAESHSSDNRDCSLTLKGHEYYLFTNLFISYLINAQRGIDERKLCICKNMLCNQECYLVWHLNLRLHDFKSVMNVLCIEKLLNYNKMHDV